MMVLITYDVNTENSAGKKRLRQVAKECVNYGHRVQNSVFECVLDEAQFCNLKNILKNIIDDKKDSIRYYRLGKNYESKIQCDGKDYSLHVEDCLIV